MANRICLCQGFHAATDFPKVFGLLLFVKKHGVYIFIFILGKSIYVNGSPFKIFNYFHFIFSVSLSATWSLPQICAGTPLLPWSRADDT